MVLTTTFNADHAAGAMMSNVAYSTTIYDPSAVHSPAGVGVLGLRCYARNHGWCIGEVISDRTSRFAGATVDCICPCHH